MATPDFKEWFQSMTQGERQVYADRAGVSKAYIDIFLIHRRRVPRPQMMRKLAEASLDRFSYKDLVGFFFEVDL
jgi:hypothetical protein